MTLRCCLLLVTLPACTGPGGKGDPTDSAAPPWSPIGTGDGSPESVGWTPILGPDDRLDDPRDLGFDADGNLWIANRDDDRTFIVFDPGTDEQDHDRRKDGYAEHFMEETAAFAFDGDAQMASCGESNNTYNDTVRGNAYMGPVLWSTDLNIFGEENPIGLGSHLDMSHESPYCVGIAWETENAYWVFDGRHDVLVRHDFQRDHGVGMDEHYDGIVHQLTEPEVERVEEAPGHLILDTATGLLYASDTGNGRVLWIDTTTGTEGDALTANDPGVVRVEWDDAEWGELATGFEQPGGLAFDGESLFVGDWATGIITQVDLDGAILRTLDTGFGAERLYGIEIGPDGLLWVIDNETGVYRIDP
ncbi:MAG: YncE family protein [Myxococcota bacterium]